MKQRTTYLLPEGAGINPGDILVSPSELQFSLDDAVTEETRLTLGLSELPEELQALLEDFHELHLRSVSPWNRLRFSPIFSTLPAGLHAFFTPRKPETNMRLCPWLKDVLNDTDVKCSDASESFSKPSILAERFATSSTYQAYYPLFQSQAILRYVTRTLCSEAGGNALCKALLNTEAAIDVDLDFDAISHALTLTVVWPPLRQGEHHVIRVRKELDGDRVEVGILSPEKAEEPEELSMGGFLTVLGDDNHAKATLFSFPSRHHSSTATYHVTFLEPTGLHPKLEIHLPKHHLAPPRDSCALHAYWTLPSALFIDRYQLSDPLFLQSQNLIALRALSGEEDLEAPNWAIKRWGSAALFELADSKSTHDEERDDWKITIPTHLRYLNPRPNATSESSQTALEIPWPVVFWACEAEQGLKFSTNPFDRVNLGYDGLFGPRTMFYHLSPTMDVEQDSTFLASEISVPVLDPAHSTWVPLGTAIAVLLGFGWVCWKLLQGSGSYVPKDAEKMRKMQ